MSMPGPILRQIIPGYLLICFPIRCNTSPESRSMQWTKSNTSLLCAQAADTNRASPSRPRQEERSGVNGFRALWKCLIKDTFELEIRMSCGQVTLQGALITWQISLSSQRRKLAGVTVSKGTARSQYQAILVFMLRRRAVHRNGEHAVRRSKTTRQQGGQRQVSSRGPVPEICL